MKSKLPLIIALALARAAAYASGAPWYKWQNTYDNTLICSQNSPGETWVIFQGPFMESGCRKQGFPQ